MVTIETVTTAGTQLDIVKELFNEYAAELNEDICFQNPEAEFANPLTKYGLPSGTILLAFYHGQPAGCVAIQPIKLDGVCEMKRMYVRPAFRKFSIGRLLAEAILAQAAQLGYHSMVLDTLQKLAPAIRLYHSLGFTETEAYYHNPLPGVVYMEKKLGS